MTLNELSDQFAVRRCLTSYALAIDRRDWGALGPLVASEIEVDFSDFLDQPPLTVSRDAFVAYARDSLSGFAATQHLALNEVTEIAGDAASSRAMMVAQHLLRDEDGTEEVLVLRGFYEVDLVRTPPAWQIARYAVKVTWVEGDVDLLRRAAQRAPSG